jgi:hypothetical protein
MRVVWIMQNLRPNRLSLCFLERKNVMQKRLFIEWLVVDFRSSLLRIHQTGKILSLIA